MTFNRTKLLLVVGTLILLLGGQVLAEEALRGFQLWAPADVRSYGKGPQPNEGYFFVFDGLYWSYSPPRVSKIGYAEPREVLYSTRTAVDGEGRTFFTDVRLQESSMDTSQIKAPFTLGQRIEFGRIVDHWGWCFSTFRTEDQTQWTTGEHVDMSFYDPVRRNPNYDPDNPGYAPEFLLPMAYGRIGQFTPPGQETIDVLANLPITFRGVQARNKIESWNVEMMWLYRTTAFHTGGFLEWSVGVRYMEINEDFSVDALGGFTINDEDISAGWSYWYTRAENHIVGPQIGLRWFRKYSRFMGSVEGRFFAGYNSQNLHQRVRLGPDLGNVVGDYGYPLTWQGTEATHSRYIPEWSPGAELRAEVRYQLTRAISFRAGWTGMWLDGIARASSVINYELPAMGIDPTYNRQGIFIHGLTMGVDVNR